MGIFRSRVTVFNLADERRSQELELVVDTGATYPVVPRSVCEALGIRPSESRVFTMANGAHVSRDLGWAGPSYDGRRAPTLVVFGEPDDIPLLGAFGLEGPGFEVDPVAKTLRPASQYLL